MATAIRALLLPALFATPALAANPSPRVVQIIAVRLSLTVVELRHQSRTRSNQLPKLKKPWGALTTYGESPVNVGAEQADYDWRLRMSPIAAPQPKIIDPTRIEVGGLEPGSTFDVRTQLPSGDIALPKQSGTRRADRLVARSVALAQRSESVMSGTVEHKPEPDREQTVRTYAAGFSHGKRDPRPEVLERTEVRPAAQVSTIREEPIPVYTRFEVVAHDRHGRPYPAVHGAVRGGDDEIVTRNGKDFVQRSANPMAPWANSNNVLATSTYRNKQGRTVSKLLGLAAFPSDVKLRVINLSASTRASKNTTNYGWLESNRFGSGSIEVVGEPGDLVEVSLGISGATHTFQYKIPEGTGTPALKRRDRSFFPVVATTTP